MGNKENITVELRRIQDLHLNRGLRIAAVRDTVFGKRLIF